MILRGDGATDLTRGSQPRRWQAPPPALLLGRQPHRRERVCCLHCLFARASVDALRHALVEATVALGKHCMKGKVSLQTSQRKVVLKRLGASRLKVVHSPLGKFPRALKTAATPAPVCPRHHQPPHSAVCDLSPRSAALDAVPCLHSMLWSACARYFPSLTLDTLGDKVTLKWVR